MAGLGSLKRAQERLLAKMQERPQDFVDANSVGRPPRTVVKVEVTREAVCATESRAGEVTQVLWRSPEDRE